MRRSDDDRAAELIAAALAGELSSSELEELERLRRTHPWIDAEITDLDAVARHLEADGTPWIPATATDSLKNRILSATARAGEPPAPPVETASAHRPAKVAPLAPRRRWVSPLLGAACLVVGLGIGLSVPGLLEASPAGPPGTLGAVEVVEVRDLDPGLTIDAEVVAHTWGTETVLDATGLAEGRAYSIVLVGRDGSEFSAGQLLGSTVPIHCRVNAAVLRQDAARLEIRDVQDEVVAVAELPQV